jgi:hypothetical protein
MTDDTKKELTADEISEQTLDRLLGKEARVMLNDEIGSMYDRAYAAGVSDAREQARNPNHRMRVPSKELKTGAATTAAAKTPRELAARASEIQADAKKDGRTVSNEEACRLAYAEANIPLK